jgi:hypothetical protein
VLHLSQSGFKPDLPDLYATVTAVSLLCP